MRCMELLAASNILMDCLGQREKYLLPSVRGNGRTDCPTEPGR